MTHARFVIQTFCCPISIVSIIFVSIMMCSDALNMVNIRSSNSRVQKTWRGRDLAMKWMFGKGPGPLQEVGGLGSQGEYY